ncbi:DUF2523 domain-containing protein [Pseudomonas sp. ML96]|uniref:DUF2523 domain-containing protein n=1 Tax=Pseudomonas sp. ML96 TaxID=1523503 RepID=UPI0005BCC8B4|nr:DUF2523 domain-containing protein [Pseudomonas sp. ML96]
MPAIFMFLSAIVGPLVAKVLTSLGIGAVSYIGITVLLAGVKTYLIGEITGLPGEILAILGLAKVDVAVNIVLSAVAARAALSGVNLSTGKKTGIGSIGG